MVGPHEDAPTLIADARTSAWQVVHTQSACTLLYILCLTLFVYKVMGYGKWQHKKWRSSPAQDPA